MVHTVWMQFIGRYGYAGLSGLLAIGIIGVPVPDEVLLTYAGYLIHTGQLALVPTVGFAFIGSAIGITISYLLGRFAGGAITKGYGNSVGITAAKIARMHAWFERFGGWLLTFGYFIPGVRHLMAAAAGMGRLEYGRFAVFAYFGAAVWCTTFITLGIYVGEEWQNTSARVHTRIIYAATGAALAAAVYVIWRWRKRF